MTELELTTSSGVKITPPITLLQEICSRNGFTAEYQLLSTEGSVHEPTFKIAVTVADITVTASGQSKKKARHAAARRAIDELRKTKTDLNIENIELDTLPEDENEESKNISNLSQNEANPVGKLQEICMKMRVNPPDYDTCDEKGLAHERVFVLSCTISSLNLTTLGEGRSKKLAKRQAAEHMLHKLETSEIYDKSSNVKSSSALELGTSSLHLDSDDDSHFVTTRAIITGLCDSLDCSVVELWNDINMIQLDDVNEDLYYELLQETVEKVGHCLFNWITDLHCILNIYNQNEILVLSSFGLGKNNASAMREATINAFKLMICLIEPLIEKEARLQDRPLHQEDLQVDLVAVGNGDP